MKPVIKRFTHNIDATDQMVGRLASKAAMLLQGKHKPDYLPYVDAGDVVIVKNASKVKISGKKFTDKVYRHHSNYPGGLKERPYKTVFAKNPSEIIRLTILKMLPKNKLRDLRLKRFKIEN